MTQDPPERPAEPPSYDDRRLADIFGDLVPEDAAEDLEDEDPEVVARRRDEEYRRDVPPHHG